MLKARFPCPVRWMVVMRFLSEEKGTSPTRGYWHHTSSPIPALAAATTRAPSVGSPRTCHEPSTLHRRESLQSTPASRRRWRLSGRGP